MSRKTHDLCRMAAALLGRLLSLVFPPACAACEAPLSTPSPGRLCDDCRGTLRPLTHPICLCCGLPLIGPTGTDHRCGNCLISPPPFVNARAAFEYRGAARALIHRIKYGGSGHALKALVEATLAHLPDGVPTPDLVVPVPLHRSRLRERGFNQAARLAAGLFPKTPCAVDLLARTRPTPPQTGLSIEKRRRNVRGAFTVSRALPRETQSVLLVDDVLTTGATAAACAKALRRAGAASVYVFTVTRTGRDRLLPGPGEAGGLGGSEQPAESF